MDLTVAYSAHMIPRDRTHGQGESVLPKDIAERKWPTPPGIEPGTSLSESRCAYHSATRDPYIYTFVYIPFYYVISQPAGIKPFFTRTGLPYKIRYMYQAPDLE